MQIQIQLSQDDIEAAIRDYLVKVGMTSPVDTINFTAKRTGKNAIEASIDLSPEGESPVSQVEKAASVVEDKPEPKRKAKTNKVDKEPEPEAVEETPQPSEETPVEEKEPEPAPTEPPFTPDEEASNDADSSDAEPAAAPSGKSLFG